jgi:hypothetical protein
MAVSQTASAATATTAMTASCQADNDVCGYMELRSFRVGEAVADRHDALDLLPRAFGTGRTSPPLLADSDCAVRGVAVPER